MDISADGFGIQYGLDRSGSDLDDMPILMDCGADAVDCALLCSLRSGCRSWASETCGDERRCWLKKSVPNLKSASCRVSL